MSEYEVRGVPYELRREIAALARAHKLTQAKLIEAAITLWKQAKRSTTP